MPPFYKAELLNVREQDSKPLWVFVNLVVTSSLLWRTEVPAQHRVSRFRDNKNFMDAILDERAPGAEVDHVDNKERCRESMGTEIERMMAFVNANWTS